jgi:hypothetical protein
MFIDNYITFLSFQELLNYVHARARRRMQRGLKRKPMALIKKLRKAKAGEYLIFLNLVQWLVESSI